MEATFEKERNVLARLATRFQGADVDQAAITVRRIYWGVPREIILDVLEFAAHELGFAHLCTITGLDTGTSYEFIYHIAGPDGILMSVKYSTGREDPVVIPSVLPIYNGATFYERELEGLLGIKVEGLPAGRQYPLPDNWPKGQYPMRKDWKPGPSQPNQPSLARQGIPKEKEPDDKGVQA